MEETVRILVPVVVAHVAVLLVVVVLIKKLLLGDTLRAVERIGQAESEIRKKEDAMREEMEQHEKDLAARRQKLEDEFIQKQESAEKDIMLKKDEVLEGARRDAAQIMDKARKNERKLRDQILQDMDSKAVDFGGRMFQLVFSDRLNEVLNKQFVEELLDALEETDAAGITVDQDAAEFTASHELEPAQRERLERVLKDKFGLDIKVQEEVREELLAGLVMKLGSLEIDGSLLSRFEEAAAELKKEGM